MEKQISNLQIKKHFWGLDGKILSREKKTLGKDINKFISPKQ